MLNLSPALRDILAAYAARLAARFGPRLRMVRLFGSFARGEATEDSDVDVAVIVEGLAREGPAEWSQRGRCFTLGSDRERRATCSRLIDLDDAPVGVYEPGPFDA